MKHYVICIVCKKANTTRRIWAVGDIQPEMFAVCECPNGHVVIAQLMHDQFDVLYTSAINAYLDSYYSESIMSFTASLERAYEQYVKLYLHSTGVELSLVDEFWKELNNQSERQYGAFCAAFVATEKTAWHSNSNQVHFRNSVIHKGYIAKRSEAELYAEYVTGKLNLIMRSIKNHFSLQKRHLYLHTKKVTSKAVVKIIEKNRGAISGQASYTSLLKWDYAVHEDATLKHAIKTAEEQRGKYKKQSA